MMAWARHTTMDRDMETSRTTSSPYSELLPEAVEVPPGYGNLLPGSGLMSFDAKHFDSARLQYAKVEPESLHK